LKRALLFLALLLFGGSGAFAQVARVSGNFVVSTGSSGTVTGTLPNPTTAHNLIAVSCEANTNGKPPFISDTQGDYATIALAHSSGSTNNANIEIFKDIIGGSSTAITCTQDGGGSGNMTLVAQEYSGADLVDPLDTFNISGTVGSPAGTGNITTVQANEMILSAAINLSGGANSVFTPTPSSGSMSVIGSTNNGVNMAGALGDMQVSSIQTGLSVSWAITNVGFAQAGIVGIKAAHSAPPVLIVQSKACNNSSSFSDLTCTFASNTTTGNLNLLGCGVDGTASVPTPSDSTSNAYTQIANNNSGGNNSTTWWYSKNITGGSTPTLHCAISASSGAMFIAEVSGLNTTSPLDAQNSSGATLGGNGPGSITTTNANDAVFTLFYDFSGTPGAWRAGRTYYTLATAPTSGSAANIGFAYSYITTTQTISGTFFDSALRPLTISFPTAMVAAFKQSAPTSAVTQVGAFAVGP
jgi:hypothetical protein